ncbi:MAG TPA: hypothetical protein DCP40_06080 [Stenotrophomonas sp.]|nr:hypothetical protein [Stenotrophomonas sp.]
MQHLLCIWRRLRSGESASIVIERCESSLRCSLRKSSKRRLSFDGSWNSFPISKPALITSLRTLERTWLRRYLRFKCQWLQMLCLDLRFFL